MALWEKAQGAAAVLEMADRLRDRGDIRMAVRLYVRLIHAKLTDESMAAARGRLDALANKARKEMAKVDKSLSGKQPSAGDLFAVRHSAAAQRDIDAWQATVAAAFNDYRRIVDRYKDLPGLGSELRAHINRQRHRSQFAVVLNEPEAKALLDAGEEHEAEGHQCCAYWVYRQALQLAPAPSAVKAQERFEELKKVPNIVALAEACREMQRCHQIYARGERVLPANPTRARELFAEVVRRAPADSEVYRAAERQLAATTE
jgi:hypothetical protein